MCHRDPHISQAKVTHLSLLTTHMAMSDGGFSLPFPLHSQRPMKQNRCFLSNVDAEYNVSKTMLKRKHGKNTIRNQKTKSHINCQLLL